MRAGRDLFELLSDNADDEAVPLLREDVKRLLGSFYRDPALAADLVYLRDSIFRIEHPRSLRGTHSGTPS